MSGSLHASPTHALTRCLHGKMDPWDCHYIQIVYWLDLFAGDGMSCCIVHVEVSASSQERIHLSAGSEEASIPSLAMSTIPWARSMPITCLSPGTALASMSSSMPAQ